MLDNLTINDLPDGVVDVVEVIGMDCLLYTSIIHLFLNYGYITDFISIIGVILVIVG